MDEAMYEELKAQDDLAVIERYEATMEEWEAHDDEY